MVENMSKLEDIISIPVADTDFELSGGPGFALLPLLAFLPSVKKEFFLPETRGAGLDLSCSFRGAGYLRVQLFCRYLRYLQAIINAVYSTTVIPTCCWRQN